MKKERNPQLYIKHKKKYCEECGAKNQYDSQYFLIRKANLTVHHIDGNPQNNDPSNLQTLCRKCHDYKHDMR